MNFIVNNEEHFQTNSTINSVNTGNKNQLHRATAKLSCFQKSDHYAGVIIFNSFNLQEIKVLEFFHRLMFVEKAQRFENWICLRLQVK
jgi:hypothetical protein